MARKKIVSQEWAFISIRVPRQLKERLIEVVTRKGYSSLSEWLRDKAREEIGE